MNRKVCVITGSRAEYGLLRGVMQGIQNHPDLVLQIIATGMHVSKDFGDTYKEIEADGFQIDKKVETLSGLDSNIGILEAMGKGLIGCGKALEELKPDLIVILGDRFEIFVAAVAAHMSRIPIAHLHGGELTIGAYDDALRHSITKMSQLHFVATEEYRNRVIQLGEDPKSVFLVGGLGVDQIQKTKILSRMELEKSLKIEFRNKSLLITYHPVTLEEFTSSYQVQELLDALAELSDVTLIFTMPNADTGGKVIKKLIEKFVEIHPNSYAFDSLGSLNYLSCLAYVDGVVGNSSSGLSEVPSFKKGTIDIGDRQKGRIRASSVIHCEPSKKSIGHALRILFSDEFKSVLKETKNPYGDGGSSKEIVEIISTSSLVGVIKKIFYDL